MLAEAERWLAERPEDLDSAERAFIEVSLALRERERAARERRRRRTMLGLVAGFLVAFFLASWALYEVNVATTAEKKAEEQKELALARQLVAINALTRNQQANLLQRSVLLAVESMEQFPASVGPLSPSHVSALPPFRVMQMKPEGNINAVAISTDGTYLATVRADRTIQVWNVARGKVDRQWTLDKDTVDVEFSPNGKYMVTANEDKTAQVWDAVSGKVVKALVPAEGDITAFDFSRDGNYVATGTSVGTIWVWGPTSDKREERMRFTPPGADEVRITSVVTVAFSPDGKYLAAASGKIVRVLKVASHGEQIPSLRHNEDVKGLAFSRDGQYLATASGGNTIDMWLWQKMR